MTEIITSVANVIKSRDNILLLAHANPDGDTIGATFALYDALKSLGKTVRIECADEFPSRFSHITNGILFEEFIPSYTIAIDVPTKNLLGSKNHYTVNMAIDHHQTHNNFAAFTYVDKDASSACEIIYDIVKSLQGHVTTKQAIALFTGIATDTGCFRFSNTTANTHIVVADLMKKDINCAKIIQDVFSSNKAKALLEAKVLSQAQFFYDDKVAIQFVDDEILKEVGAHNEDIGVLPSALQRIDCVMIGITVHNMGENRFKLSVRSKSPVSSSKFCEKFGGGGHECAAGCFIESNDKDIMSLITEEAKNICKEADILEE